MLTLTVTAGGRITLPKALLQHLGVRPGGCVELSLLPDGRVGLKASLPTGPITDLHGLLADKTNGARLSIEEINDAIAKAGAAAGLGDIEN